MPAMIVATCMHCQTLIYGGVTPGVWVDSSKDTIDQIMLCKKEGQRQDIQHTPHYWITEKGGTVVYDNRYHRYVFVEAPSGYDKGDFMPEGWGIS